MRIANAGREISLERLQSGSGCSLLLLHELYGSCGDWSATGRFDPCRHWTGPVFALDFAGHGASDWLSGGWYSPEGCVADADLALAEIGSVAIAGAGLGAYVGLLLSGARPKEVLGTLLLPGMGLEGAGAEPKRDDYRDAWGGSLPTDLPPEVDPMTCCLARDLRPVDYARPFAEASAGLLLHQSSSPPPPWWEALDGRNVVHLQAHDHDAAASFRELTARANR